MADAQPDPESASNSLGLNFDQLKIQESSDTESKPAPDAPKDAQPTTEKKKPYVNPERVKTGGNQRDKLSDEALTERMARMREQNEKIKQRRLDVQADEDAFKKTQEVERVKLAQSRKVQEGVDRTREQNAKRKLDKMQNREWDSGKPVGGGDWKQRQAPKSDAPQTSTSAVDQEKTENSPDPTSAPTSPSTNNDSGNWTRGGPRGSPRGRGGGRGRGRGRGAAPATAGSNGEPDKPSVDTDTAKDAPPHVTSKEETTS
ncbi:hypothetical protein R3P38DRAFT_3194359 [Favolaschia claudopus]|uniref:Uncharacterized protein n=1 Tax=Favolaschia claudopus TaxID=2862362 RepID=A0AAW0BDI2_9AGAR